MGVRPAAEQGVLPQSSQNVASQQAAVQTVRAVPQVSEMESMGTARRSADTGGTEPSVNADVLNRTVGGQSRMDAQRRADAQARSPEASRAGRQEAVPRDEAARQAEMERLQQTMNQIAEYMGPKAGGFRFSVDEELGRVIVRIVDPETHELIKQIPSEEAIALSKSLGKTTGMLVRTTA